LNTEQELFYWLVDNNGPQKGNYINFGALNSILSQGKDYSKIVNHKLVTSGDKAVSKTTSIFGNNRDLSSGRDKFSNEKFNWENSSQFHQNLGLKSSRIEVEKNELVKKVVSQVLLKADILFGNSSGYTTKPNQGTYLLQNLNQLSGDDLKEILSDPNQFLSDFSKYDLDKAPSQTIQNYSIELSQRREKKNSVLHGGVQFTLNNAFAGKTNRALSAAMFGDLKKTLKLSDNATVVFDANLLAVLNTTQKDLYDGQSEQKLTLKYKVHAFQQNGVLHLSLGAKEKISGTDKLNVSEVNLDLGVEISNVNFGIMLSVDPKNNLNNIAKEALIIHFGFRLPFKTKIKSQ
jgi:hypothetical protein